MAKSFTGVVTSDKGNKTIIVSVQTRKTHPIYKKQFTVSKKFAAHDESNTAKEGDKVIISEIRPISKTKAFTLVEVTEKAPIKHIETEEIIPEIVKKSPKPTAKKEDDKEITASKEEKK